MAASSADALKGRAGVVRPLACVVALLIGTMLVMACPAEAATPTPELTETNPASSAEAPAMSTTPLIRGKGEASVITSVVADSLAVTGPGAPRALEPSEYKVQIFATAGCSGAPLATGLVSELEGAGIEVTVPADSVTTLSAREINPEEEGSPSNCSNSIRYWEGNPPPEEVSTPGGESPGGGSGSTPSPSGSGSPSEGVSPAVPAGPPSPPRLRTNPGGWANDNTPAVTGSAPGAVTVKVFTTAGCAGSPVAKGSAEQLAAGIPVQVVDNVVVAFYGISVGPTGLQSECSAPVYYGEDSLAPHVRITMAPAAKTRKRKAVIRFTDTTGNTPGTIFKCRVNRKKWRKCSSPLRLKHLKRNRKYVVRVKATDPAGNVSRKPAKRRFKVI